jgi:hypothetical protein
MEVRMAERAKAKSSLPTKHTVHSLIIVARPQRELWRALTREFRHIEEIQVLLDRRQGERRRAVRLVAHDRRATERRSLPRLEDDLRARRYILVRPRCRRRSN